VLRDVFYVLLGKQDVSVLVKMELEGEQLEIFCLDGLLTDSSTPQFSDGDLIVEDYHTVLPALHPYPLRHLSLQLDQ
jgi:hypothetical protein